uniref:Amphiregulin n=1 Tax=Stegastes partitus TaxID=144197 RepID=A0A3B5BE46_9TELE
MYTFVFPAACRPVLAYIIFTAVCIVHAANGKSTTAFNPEHTLYTSRSTSTSTLSAGEDPCTSTYLGYCIHGHCKYIEGLKEPVCICMKGYDGERCGIQTLETVKNQPDQSSNELRIDCVPKGQRVCFKVQQSGDAGVKKEGKEKTLHEAEKITRY